MNGIYSVFDILIKFCSKWLLRQQKYMNYQNLTTTQINLFKIGPISENTLVFSHADHLEGQGRRRIENPVRQIVSPPLPLPPPPNLGFTDLQKNMVGVPTVLIRPIWFVARRLIICSGYWGQCQSEFVICYSIFCNIFSNR